MSILTIPGWSSKYSGEVNGGFRDLFKISLSYLFMLLGQNSHSIASIMMQAIVARSGEEGFWL